MSDVKITRDWAWKFAKDWVEAWNTHDLDRVLRHYTDDFEMSSPYIVQFAGEPSGTLKGKERVQSYWQKALEKIPNLKFELDEVFVSANSVAIYYRAALGKRAVEVFFFNPDGKVYKAAAHYNEV
jgi:ketosteroid isomerase-like protein